VRQLSNVVKQAGASAPYTVLAWIGLLWTLGNCAYVYLFGHPDHAYRIESSLWILAAVLLPVLLSTSGVRRAPVLTLRDTQVTLTSVVVVWAALYVPLIRLPFLSDDYVFLQWSQSSGRVLHASEFFRPAFATTFLVLSRLSRSPTLFHGVSLALHLGNALLAYVLATRILSGRGPAALVFTLFLLNPAQLEAVLWVSGLQELLWTFFLLAGLWLYTRPPLELSSVRVAGVAGCTILALLSKETAICCVLLFPFADFLLGRWARPSTLRAYAAFAVIVAGYLVLHATFAHGDPRYWAGPSRYFVKEFLSRPYAVFGHPWNASAVAVPAIQRFTLAVTLVTLLFAAVMRKRVGRRLLIGPMVILFSTAPLYGYFYVGPDLIASRYVYFAAIGWGLLVAELIAGVTERRSTYLLAVVLTAACCAVSLGFNMRPWRAAGTLVDAMRAAIVHGDDLDRSILEWRQTHPGTLEMRGGVPYEYDGVGVFINGYAEFRQQMLTGTDRDLRKE
jgi:hypothetical protein